MKVLFFSLCFVALVACASQPAPTPPPLQQFPATWTLAPTPTNTPPGPTPTLVIQNTRGPLPTRDPNARILPTIPFGSAGTWIDLTDTPRPANPNTAANAQIIVTSQTDTIPRRNEQFLIVETQTAPGTDALAPGVNGIVMEFNALTDAAQVDALRERIKPRLVLARASVSDTNALAQVAPNVDGLLLDNFLRTAATPLNSFADELAWKNQIDTLSRYSTNPDFVVLAAPRFPAKIQESQMPASQQWSQYALASFLLGANNAHTFFGLEPFSFLNTPTLQKTLGLPFGSYIKLSGVYQRRFANGIVLVNPSDETRAFFLPRAYVDFNGAPVPQLEMAPHTGEILYNAPQ